MPAIQLRENVTIQIPDDLTFEEAEKLQRFVSGRAKRKPRLAVFKTDYEVNFAVYQLSSVWPEITTFFTEEGWSIMVGNGSMPLYLYDDGFVGRSR